MFWNLLTVENTKNLRRKLLWIEMVLLAFFVVAIFFFLYVAIQGVPDGVTITDGDLAKIPQLITWPGALAFSLRFASGSKLILIIFVGAATASEYPWRTYQLWLSRGIPRSHLLVAKFISFLLPTIGVVIVALVFGGSISTIFSMQINGTLFLDQINVWQLGLDILRSAYTLLPYAAITFLLAIASRSVVAAIGGCTAFGLIIENTLAQFIALLPGSFAQLSKYLPARLTESVLSMNWAPAGLMDEIPPGLLAPAPAAFAIALWTLSLLTLAMWLFKRQDFTG